jgi:hypothetical protein
VFQRCDVLGERFDLVGQHSKPVATAPDAASVQLHCDAP